MAFTADLEIIKDSFVKITLSGELDGATAADFQTKVEEAAAKKPTKLFLMMQDLEFMASAGLRVLIYLCAFNKFLKNWFRSKCLFTRAR